MSAFVSTTDYETDSGLSLRGGAAWVSVVPPIHAAFVSTTDYETNLGFASRRRGLGFGGPTRPPINVFPEGWRPPPPACFACGDAVCRIRQQLKALVPDRQRAPGGYWDSTG
jgi:hypothetical protein